MIEFIFWFTIFAWILFEFFFNVLKHGDRLDARLLIPRNFQRFLNGLTWSGFGCLCAIFFDQNYFLLSPSGAKVGAGCGIIGLSLLFRWFVIQVLGCYFSATISVFQDHKLIEAGPYKLFRHPQYLAELVAFLGLGLCLHLTIYILLFYLLPIIGFILKIFTEENALGKLFKERYINYQRRTYRIIPYIY